MSGNIEMLPSGLPKRKNEQYLSVSVKFTCPHGGGVKHILSHALYFRGFKTVFSII